ncbi:methyltransferase [Microbacterium sp. B2969]|uniref:Methyltransferase n=1 Tax=Microbacterium alkaliflavum TaxID=3248839 RepID=A0ABW7Q5B7_9MICO
MSDTQTRRLWVAYGPAGAVGTIEKSAEDSYAVKMAGADAAVGTYPSMEVAKNALFSHLKPGSDWPEFREH